VWVFQTTGSATQFALLEVASVLPGLIALPFLGVLTDRLGPRRALLLADAAGMFSGLVIAACFAASAVTPGILLALLTARNLLTATHWPAYSATTTLLVGPERVPRAAALMQFGYVGQTVIAPAAAGALLGILGVAGIVAIDVASFAAALGATLLTRLPFAGAAAGASWRAELERGIATVRRSGLFPLALYVAATYLPGGLVVALATPVVLSIATPATLGLVTSIMGCGMLAGSVVATRVIHEGGGVRRLLRYDVLLAAAMISIGLTASPGAIAAEGFLFLFGLAGLLAEEQALWLVRVPPEEQARVFAVRRLITWGSLPISYALAGPLADRVFEPMVRNAGYAASPIGALIGTAPGRGMALLLLCGGLAKLAIIVAGRRSQRLRALDEE